MKRERQITYTKICIVVCSGVVWGIFLKRFLYIYYYLLLGFGFVYLGSFFKSLQSCHFIVTQIGLFAVPSLIKKERIPPSV